METIKEAKEYLRANWDKQKGTKCPCCGQGVKRYKRPLHYSMVICLIRLYKLVKNNQSYYHVNDFGADSTNGGDFAKLKYWGLIIEKPKDANNKKTRTSGFWTISLKGRLFVESKVVIPERVILYNKKCLGFDGQEIYIRDALGTGFNYEEMMQS